MSNVNLNYALKNGNTAIYLIRAVNMRNHMLRDTDYLMLPDVYEKLDDIQKEEIKLYRQELRDFINNNRERFLEGDFNLNLPKQPSFINIPIPKY